MKAGGHQRTTASQHIFFTACTFENWQRFSTSFELQEGGN
jgi:hypothetical protein